MRRIHLAVAALTVTAACSGPNPFETTTDPDPTTPTDIPEELTSDVDGVSYDATNQVLTITGLTLEGATTETAYTRKPGLDRAGYEAYTAQNTPLQRHATAYVKQMDGLTGTVAVTGGQNGTYFGGTNFGRSGSYSAPPGGAQVTYLGNYVGLRNVAGDGGDLAPVPAGTDPAQVPSQAAEVTGRVQMTANFGDGSVEGRVFNRQSVDSGLQLDVIDLDATTIDDNGQFAGEVTQDTQSKGSYGGIFGGAGATAVAGTLFASDHIPGQNQEEYGMWVIAQCGTPNADASCP